MIILKLLFHFTVGAYVSWAFGRDEGWDNWKKELVNILTGKD